MLVDTEQMRCWAEIDLSALENNYRRMREMLPPGCRFLGVVKADAYGHGAVRVAQKLESLGAEYLAVAFLDEAVALRAAGVRLPILILGHTDPAFTPLLLENDVTQAVVSLEAARAYNACAQRLGGRLRCHLKVDSGMGRLGFFDGNRAEEMLEALRLEALDFEGIFTHFAVADEPELDYTDRQLAVFTALYKNLECACGQKFRIKHCAASSGMINYAQSCLDMVRPGIALYGHYPAAPAARPALEPVMRLKCRVMQLKRAQKGESVSYGRTWIAARDSRIAVLGIGYGDGLHRVLSNRASVVLHGKRVPLVGRICMDMAMADVTDLPEVRTGDVAEVFGVHLPVEEQAALCGTISYELLCAVAPRVPRIYLDGPDAPLRQERILSPRV